MICFQNLQAGTWVPSRDLWVNQNQHRLKSQPASLLGASRQLVTQYRQNHTQGQRNHPDLYRRVRLVQRRAGRCMSAVVEHDPCSHGRGAGLCTMPRYFGPAGAHCLFFHTPQVQGKTVRDCLSRDQPWSFSLFDSSSICFQATMVEVHAHYLATETEVYALYHSRNLSLLVAGLDRPYLESFTNNHPVKGGTKVIHKPDFYVPSFFDVGQFDKAPVTKVGVSSGGRTFFVVSVRDKGEWNLHSVPASFSSTRVFMLMIQLKGLKNSPVSRVCKDTSS